MALTPGGGRTPSTKPPPTPPSNGQYRPGRDQRTPPPPISRLAWFSVVRWGVLFGGLVIIADLTAQAVSQRTLSPDDLTAISTADYTLNFIFFAILGVLVVRETGVAYLGAVAGVVASLLDGIVVAAAASMAPPSGPVLPVEEYLVSNLALWSLVAGLGGVVYMVIKRWSGGRRSR